MRVTHANKTQRFVLSCLEPEAAQSAADRDLVGLRRGRPAAPYERLTAVV